MASNHSVWNGVEGYNGHVIDAHGGGFLQDGGVYYWYGSQRNGYPCYHNDPVCHDGGINCYSSRDLYHWTFEARIIQAFNASDTGNGLDLERPKVVRCAATKQYVLWMRGTGLGNTPQLLAVAVANTATGPFSFVGNRTLDPFRTIFKGNRNLPAGYQYADATLFQDPVSLRTYVYWRTRINPQRTGFRAMELTGDCLDVVPASDTRLLETANREAPAVFYANGLYYLWTSGTNGWNPSTVHLYTASHPLGPFNQSGVNTSRGWLVGLQPPPIPNPGELGNRAPAQPGEWSFASQSTFVLPNPEYVDRSSTPPFIYMADRWTPSNGTHFGTYVWLPLFIDPSNYSRLQVVWRDEWRLDEELSPFTSHVWHVVED
eukprot:CAMPEP_0115829012 /NCGR_PEP_ID=MMETSP0287-20121206/876_1 /TAXON_ID=412157 /ORGANISM="Chrysochromulina rotalis, Strain UIO044" /LENGTH=373 /DNA_ID=CAMNT_0003282259 /DNA_START=56 /DNA_END=1178 /DNA_ORIENTATION=+